MPDPVLTDQFVFEPHDGGAGARISVTATSSRIAVPGTEATPPGRRIIISNSGYVSAYVRMGQSGVVATTSCMEILPGVAYVLSSPQTLPTTLWVAAITALGATTINIIAGKGV